MTHEHYMQLALDEAKKAWGHTSPNPMVGALVVKDGKILSSGYHQACGLAHAEPDALDKLSNAQCQGARLYVTLEPCCTHGRTPACTQKIIDKGIKEVFYGSQDPNPEHAGSGFATLAKKGIPSQGPFLEEACLELNRAFFHWIQSETPYIILKMASTLDGRIATQSGQSQWITGPKAREHVQNLRKYCDAIMVGGETVKQDNPSLQVKEQDWPSQPQRFIWTQQDLDRNLAVFRTDDGAQATCIKPETKAQWQSFLNQLGQENKTCLLLEGGGELASSALRAGIVNEVQFFIAPKILGGRDSRNSVQGANPLGLDEAIELKNMTCQQLGADFLFTALPIVK